MTRPATSIATCHGFRKNGSACQSPATSNGWCFWHDPDRPTDEKHAAAMKGGLMSRPKALPATTPDVRMRSPESCLMLLEETTSQMRRGELDVRTGNAISYAVSSAVKVWEILLSDRIDKLEKLIHGRVRRR